MTARTLGHKRVLDQDRDHGHVGATQGGGGFLHHPIPFPIKSFLVISVIHCLPMSTSATSHESTVWRMRSSEFSPGRIASISMKRLRDRTLDLR